MRWCGFACLVLVIVSSSESQAQKKKAGKGATFADVVETHFADWDHDGNGKLTSKEVDALVLSQKVTGDEAAAVAAIHIYLRDHKTPAPLTKAFLQTPDKGAKDAPERRDLTQKGAHFGLHFSGFRQHISKAPREVFATKEAPSLTGFHQGNLGDCYFLASVAAAIHADQAAFRKMFVPRNDGACDVRFFSGHVVHVPKLTDAEIALSSSAGEQGLWLNIIEKAFGEIKMQVRNANPKAHKDTKGPNTLGLDVIARGGFSSEAIEVLSGMHAKYYEIRKGSGEEPPHIQELPRMKAELHAALSASLPRKFLFCCGVPGSKSKPPGIVSNHAYAIVGYDAKTQMVTVMNPWGNKFTPKGDPGLANGYTTEGGKFDVPLNDFVQICDGVYYQTPLRK